jgi:hypothetical protein
LSYQLIARIMALTSHMNTLSFVRAYCGRSMITLALAAIFSASAIAGTEPVRRVQEPVHGQYLVALRNLPAADVAVFAGDIARGYEGQVRAVFQHASTGFAIYLSDAQAEKLAKHPNVDFVEEVAIVHASASPQTSAPWQLDRIDQATGTDGLYHYSETGANSLIYVIGQGVYRDHSEFALAGGASRVIPGTKFANDTSIRTGDTLDYGYWPCGSPGAPVGNPSAGHDTAVASFAAGTTQGVAKEANIVSIRVFDCNGNADTVNLNYAIDWIMNPTQNPYYYVRPAVVNMSLAIAVCGTNDPVSYVENEINKLVGHPYVSGTGCTLPGPGDFSGIPVVVSANNFNTDAVFTSPARMAFTNTSFSSCGHVISVGATDVYDRRWICTQQEPSETCYNIAAGFCGGTSTPGSNYGPSVDIYAPGAGVSGARQTGPYDYVTNPEFLSGTSYAAPIVAGVIARMMQVQGSMSCDTAWLVLQASASYVISWDQVGGQNKPLVNRQ